jgi:hypothetical protein
LTSEPGILSNHGTFVLFRTSKTANELREEGMKQFAAVLISWICFQDDVSRAIEQLGAPDRVTRNEAEKQLLRQVGSKKVQDELEKLEKSGDPERAGRARDILSWVRPTASPAGIRLGAQLVVQESGSIRVKIGMTNTGDQHCTFADPDYWDCWKFFTLEILQKDGSVAKGKLRTTRDEGNFRGMAPAAVPLGIGMTKWYSDAVVEGLAPGTHLLRITAGSMEGAKGYEGRAPRELPASKGAVAIVTVAVPGKQ